MEIEDIEAKLLKPCFGCAGGISEGDKYTNENEWPQLNLGKKCWACLGSGLQKDIRECSQCSCCLYPVEREQEKCNGCYRTRNP